MENEIKKVGSWLFLIGICVALVVGLIFGVAEATNTTLTNEVTTGLGIITAVLGFIVGVLSFFALGAITHDKIPTFLIASLILVGLGIAVSSTTWIFENFGWFAPLFTNITQYLAIFVAPAAIILVVRSLWDSTKTKETAK
jgi:drug/metabolite transporter (DMT)-like permease